MTVRLRAVYPDISLSLDENLPAKEEGRRKRARRHFASHFSHSHGPLRFVTSHSRVTRVSHSNLCGKRNA